MSGVFTAACVQLASDIEPEANLRAAAEAIRRARDAGADFVLTPETTDMMEMKRRDAFAKAKGEAEHPGLAQLRDLAGELGDRCVGPDLRSQLPSASGVAGGDRVRIGVT